jgi:hypothetical protein
MQVMIMKASAVGIPIAPAIELRKILYATDFFRCLTGGVAAHFHTRA